MNKILVLLLVLTLLATGCSPLAEDTNSVESANGDSEISEQSEVTQLTETAKRLLEADRLVTELFVGGLLAELVDTEGKNPIELTEAANSEYQDFYVIEKLLSSTYSIASGVINKYLTFPDYGTRAITSEEGKTLFSFHFIEEINHINIEGIKLSAGDSDNQKFIIAGIYSIPMVFDGSVWLLENSVYFLQKEQLEYNAQKPLFHAMDAGTAKGLNGRILAVSVFISDSRTSFSEEETEDFETRIENSFDFITESALSYGNILDVDFGKLMFKYKGEINFSANDPYAFDFVLAGTSYEYLDKYINDNFNTGDYNSYLIFLCSPKEGMSYTHPFSEHEEDGHPFYAERCVIFSNTDEGEITRGVLSLFGAETQRDEYLNALMKNYVQNEVMQPDVRFEDAVISQLTAYQTGITKVLDRQFHVFYSVHNEDDNKEYSNDNDITRAD